MRRPTPAQWRQAAGMLAARLPLTRLHPAVVAWARSTAGASANWAVGFSGGADSLALLLLLCGHWPGRRRRLLVLHFNHRLRGRAAANDERFCRSVCRALGVRFAGGAWREPIAGASEAEAREARQSFFAKHLGGRRPWALWLGHQQDDVAESLLMRLARGSGTGGLAAPRPVQSGPGGRVHLRPLLTLKKRELAATLRLLELPWREDATNAGSDYLRNRIRHAVVPAWQQAVGERDALAGAALARELMEEDDAALEAWADAVTTIDPKGRINRQRLEGRPRALVRRVLHRWLAWHGRGQAVSRQAFAALLDDVVTGRVTRHSLGTGVFAVLGRRLLELESGSRKVSR